LPETNPNIQKPNLNQLLNNDRIEKLKLQKIENNHLLPLLGLENKYPIIQQNRTIVCRDVFTPIHPKNWTFAQLSYFYQKTNTICLSSALGVNYKHSSYDRLRTPNGLKCKGNYQGSTINRILCSKFHCDRCRTLLKYKLKNEIQNALEDYQLYTHFVITTEGTDYRNYNDYIQSYTDMSHAWNKIRKILSYDAKKQGKNFTYICLIRAQKNGYCHLHVLTNLYIPKTRLTEISSKYFNTGFIKIKSNKDIANYLTNHLLKDHEYYIPFGRRHYTTSRNINLDIYDKLENELQSPENSMHIRLEPLIPFIDQIYEQIEHEYGYPPPFDFMLSQFTAVKPTLISGTYSDGNLKTLSKYTEKNKYNGVNKI